MTPEQVELVESVIEEYEAAGYQPDTVAALRALLPAVQIPREPDARMLDAALDECRGGLWPGSTAARAIWTAMYDASMRGSE